MRVGAVQVGLFATLVAAGPTLSFASAMRVADVLLALVAVVGIVVSRRALVPEVHPSGPA